MPAAIEPSERASAERQSVSALTSALLGAPMGLSELEELLSTIEPSAHSSSATTKGVWVGSVGYEKFPDNEEFAQRLKEQGVERVIDVRELPISRRRGFAKTALSGALESRGIEYLHLKWLGNPKPIRDLYKSGHVADARLQYEEFLLGEHRDQLQDLVLLLEEKPTTLMCLEHDQRICHRDVIIAAAEDSLGISLRVAALA